MKFFLNLSSISCKLERRYIHKEVVAFWSQLFKEEECYSTVQRRGMLPELSKAFKQSQVVAPLTD